MNGTQSTLKQVERVRSGVISYHQPLIALPTCAMQPETFLYEALGRLVIGGVIVPPEVFIPVLEKHRLMRKFDRLVALYAINQLAEWQRMGECVSIHLNANPDVLTERAYVDMLIAVVCRADLSPWQVTVEILEDCEFYADRAVLANLGILKDAGFKVAIDDFPNCREPEALLKWIKLQKMQLDYLKLDRSLTLGLAQKKVREEAARYIRIAHYHGMKVVAEGIETEAQAHAWRMLGADMLQGFLYGRPEPAAGAYHVVRREQVLSAAVAI